MTKYLTMVIHGYIAFNSKHTMTFECIIGRHLYEYLETNNKYTGCFTIVETKRLGTNPGF